jgi:hypothetical protein
MWPCIVYMILPPGGMLCDVSGSSTTDAWHRRFLPSPADIINLGGPQNPAH